MAVDVHNFITEPTSTEGLDRLSANLYNQRQQKLHLQKESEAKQAASTKFFANYLDKKDEYTGTNYDPIRHELISKSLNQAMELVKQGASDSDILTAIDPMVGKANQYTLAARQYSANEKQAIADAEKAGNIDMPKFIDALRKEAWEGKDPSQVDPTKNYADEVINKYPVLTNQGFKESADKDKPNIESAVIKYTNKKGGSERSKVKLTVPSYAVAIKDDDGTVKEVVPKFQVATDEGNPIMHTFQTDQGDVNAEVRLYDKNLFYNMPPKEMAYVVQEAREYAKEKGVSLNTAQMENLARAVAYDMKKATIHTNYETVDEKKDNPAPKITINVGGTKAEQRAALTQNDLYKALDETPVDQNGHIDITPLTGGIAYLKNSRGKQISQPYLKFNPTDKTVTFQGKDIDGNEVKPETVSLSYFKSMAKSNNSKEDLDYLEFLRNYSRNSNKKIDTDAPGKSAVNKVVDAIKNIFPSSKKPETKPTNKQISRSDINTKAASSGYTPKEYEELLKQKGIKIID